MMRKIVLFGEMSFWGTVQPVRARVQAKRKVKTMMMMMMNNCRIGLQAVQLNKWLDNSHTNPRHDSFCCVCDKCESSLLTIDLLRLHSPVLTAECANLTRLADQSHQILNSHVLTTGSLAVLYCQYHLPLTRPDQR